MTNGLSKLLHAGMRLRQYKDELVRALSNAKIENETSRELRDSAAILLVECDGILRQMDTLEFNESAKALLAQCEEKLVQVEILRVVTEIQSRIRGARI